MIIYGVLALCAIAVVLEFFGPVVLEKFFPQALMAPAPEAAPRSKRAAAREEAIEDEMSVASNVLTSPAMMNAASAALATQGLAISPSANSASTDEALLLTGIDPLHDFDDYPVTASDDGSKHAPMAFAAQAVQAPQVEVIQGIPDMFADDHDTQTA